MKRYSILLLALMMTSLSSQGQYYFYDVCDQQVGSPLTLSSGITVTCGIFDVGTGIVHNSTGSEDPQLSPEGTEIRAEPQTSIGENGSGWTNYVGLTLHFDAPILLGEEFKGADIDFQEQMAIFAYNSIDGQWVLPVNIALGNSVDLRIDDESMVNNFPLPAGAPSPSATGILIPTVNSNVAVGLTADDTNGHFFPDFNNAQVTDIFFLYAMDIVRNVPGSSRSAFFSPDFNLLQPSPISDLSLTKQANSNTINVGGSGSFTLSLNNSGPEDASNVIVNDLLPSGYNYTGSNPSIGSYSNINGDWTIPTISGGETATLVINVTGNASGNYLNQAEITAAEADDPDSDPTTGFGIDDLGDGIADDDEASASMSINLAPTANTDIEQTFFDIPVLINVASNDSDPNNNINASSFNVTCPVCTGPSNGTLTNSGNGNFNYTPNSGFLGEDSFIYEVCDDMGLCDTATVYINVIWDPACASTCSSVIAVSNTEICLGESIAFDGTQSSACASINVNSYQWDFGNGNTSDQDVLTYTFPSAGSYDVSLTIGTDSMCTDQMIQTIIVYGPPAVQLTLPSQSCLYDKFTLSSTPSGGVYSGLGVNGQTFDATQAGLGTHLIHYNYTDGNGCSASDSAFITINSVPQTTLDPVNDLCVSDSPVALPSGTPLGGNYEGTGVTNTNIDPNVLGEGDYYVSYVFTDGNGCMDTSTSNFNVMDIQRDTVYAVICDGDTYTLPNGEVVDQPGTYVDTNLTTGLCGLIQTTIISLSFNTRDTLHVGCRDTTDYVPTFAVPFTVSVDVHDDLNIYGCDSVTVFYNYTGVGLCPEDCGLFIPTAFTPNSDGLNEVFNAISNCPNILASFEMRIYNRWGEQIFETNSINDFWDGSFKGSESPQDVYTYIVKFDHTLGLETSSGSISILR